MVTTRLLVAFCLFVGSVSSGKGRRPVYAQVSKRNHLQPSEAPAHQQQGPPNSPPRAVNNNPPGKRPSIAPNVMPGSTPASYSAQYQPAGNQQIHPGYQPQVVPGTFQQPPQKALQPQISQQSPQKGYQPQQIGCPSPCVIQIIVAQPAISYQIKPAYPAVSPQGVGVPNQGYPGGYPTPGGGQNQGYPGAGQNQGYPGAGQNQGYPGAGQHQGYPGAGQAQGRPPQGLGQTRGHPPQQVNQQMQGYPTSDGKPPYSPYAGQPNGKAQKKHKKGRKNKTASTPHPPDEQPESNDQDQQQPPEEEGTDGDDVSNAPLPVGDYEELEEHGTPPEGSEEDEAGEEDGEGTK